MLFPLEQKGLNCIAWLRGNPVCLVLISRFGPRSGTGGVPDGLARSAVYTNKKMRSRSKILEAQAVFRL